MQITTIGLDIAKNMFQVHGIDAAEKVVVRKQLRRGQVIAFNLRRKERYLFRCVCNIKAARSGSGHNVARQRHTRSTMPTRAKMVPNAAATPAIQRGRAAR